MRRGWRRFERRSVLVQLRNGAAIEGVLLDGRNPLEIGKPVVHVEGASPAPMAGSAIIDLAEIVWVQTDRS